MDLDAVALRCYGKKYNELCARRQRTVKQLAYFEELDKKKKEKRKGYTKYPK